MPMASSSLDSDIDEAGPSTGTNATVGRSRRPPTIDRFGFTQYEADVLRERHSAKCLNCTFRIKDTLGVTSNFVRHLKTIKAIESAIVAIGNPLLDISITGTKEFLKKYELDANNQILAEEKHVPMFKDMVDNFQVDYIPGGATQNSIRLAQWILGEPKRCAFFGCIGKDEYGKILKDKMQEIGAHVNYLVTEEHPTGTCACVLTGDDRSLVANLAAANHYKKDHLLQPENWAHVEKSRIIYTAGFHLTVAPDAMVALGKHAAEKNKIFSINMSAPFLCQFFKEQQMSVMPYVDYLFGNETEYAAFAKEQNMETEDLKEIALKAAALPKENSKRDRVVVITQGSEPTIVAYRGKVTEYPVIPVKAEDIVDTNGAGDCFVGGFLSQLIQDKTIEECIKAANYGASYIIQQSGITMPDKPNLDFTF